jgi:hypothetical protein
MRTVIIALFAAFMLTGFTECHEETGNRKDPGTPPTATLPTKTGEQLKIEELQKQLTDAEKATATAAATGKTTEKLMGENTILQLHAQIAEQQQIQLGQYIKSLEDQSKAKEKEIEKSRINDWQWRLYYAAMAFAALAIIAGIIYAGWELLDVPAKWAMIIFGGLATAATVIGSLLPYIVWFVNFIPYLLIPVGIIVLAYIIGALRHWWKSHNTTKQFTALVPKLKAIGIDIEQHMQNELDSSVLAHVEQVGKKMAARAKATAAPLTAKTMDLLNPTKPT